MLVDTDVVLDVLLDRDPFAEGSKRLWASIERGGAQGLLAAHTLTTVHYLVRQSKGTRVARDVVGLLLRVFDVATVDEGVLKRAVQLDFADFEDAVSSAAAEACRLPRVRAESTPTGWPDGDADLRLPLRPEPKRGRP